MRDEERRLSRGEWMYPPAGYHSFPPKRPRFPGPRQECPHCELPAYTTDKHCPVCGSRYKRTLWQRLTGRRP